MPGRARRNGPRAELLREIRPITQPDPGLNRRWYTCAGLDLYIWEAQGALCAFELCYDKPHSQRALRWTEAGGLIHTRVDDGETSPLRNRTPIAVPDGEPDLARILDLFEAAATQVDPAVRERVSAALGPRR